MSEEVELRVNGKAFQRLSRAKREGESFSDVIIRLSTATLEGPGNGGTVAAGDLNGRGFIDVSYAVPSGDRLDASSITDLAPEFTVTSTTGSPGTALAVSCSRGGYSRVPATASAITA